MNTFKNGDLVLIMDHPATPPHRRQHIGQCCRVIGGAIQSPNHDPNFKPNEYYQLGDIDDCAWWVNVLMPLDPPDDIKDEDLEDNPIEETTS